MKRYELVSRITITGSGPEYGCGDYATTRWQPLGIIEARDERDAQRQFKKLLPQLKLSFSGQFAPYRVWEVEVVK